MPKSSPFPSYESDDLPVAVFLHEPDPDVQVPEALIHDLWRHQRFDVEDLSTTDGSPVQIFDPGRQNSDAGPDFSGAHIRIDEMEWRGDVEIHTTSGGWFEHSHHTDPRYDRVILHVTLRADVWTGGLLRHDESTLPEIVLGPRLDAPLRRLLRAFHTRADPDTLACATRWNDVPTSKKRDWISRLARERLQSKQDRMASGSEASLDERLQEYLFAGLGYSKNDEPMRRLAQRLPPERVRSLETQESREALHFGVAGLLPAPADLLDADRETADYAMALRDRFHRLQVEYDLPSMDQTAWTFFRLRPNNFPPLRIAQAVAWYTEDGLLSGNPLPPLRSALEGESPATALRDALEATPPSFWRTHYHLTKTSAEHDPSLGASRRDTLLVNAVVPALLLDAEQRDDRKQARAALQVLQSLSAPRDSVLRRFRDLGTEVNSAFEAQGLHHLYRRYCTEGGCLDCAIGRHLLEM